MAIKLLMRWNILPEKESEYFEFLVHEFIPSLNRLGVEDILVWYTEKDETVIETPKPLLLDSLAL